MNFAKIIISKSRQQAQFHDFDFVFRKEMCQQDKIKSVTIKLISFHDFIEQQLLTPICMGNLVFICA